MSNSYEMEILKEYLKGIGKWDEFSKFAEEKGMDAPLNDVTIVTGMWDLGRGELEGWANRHFETYKENFFKLLKANIPMCIWIPSSLEEEVWAIRKKHNTKVYIKETEDFKTWFPFFEQHEKIRTSPEWYERAGWLASSPQGALPLYNPMMMTKMFMVNDSALMNPFNTNHFYWIDGGLCSTVPSSKFADGDVFRKIPLAYKDSIVHIAYPYEPNTEIHGFEKTAFYKACGLPTNSTQVLISRGGFWGGPKELIHEYNKLYYGIMESTINGGHIGADECLFTIAAYKYPDMIERFEIEGNGLVYPFFDAMQNAKEFVKSKPKKPVTYRTAKSNLYVLGFNSPQQFEWLCESIQRNGPEFMEKPRKILINNSNDESTFEEYDRLCEKYGFEELHFDNLGICGGRQYVAEHFDESDADFYFFFEDDLTMNDATGATCKSGFRTHVPNLYELSHKIIIEEKFDFLKLCFSEFYASNNVQISWYNVPQSVRTEVWPHYDKLPERGFDPNNPLTEFKNIKSLDGLAYATGEIYYSNWPIIVSREGNKKMFIDTKWARPMEQTWMSHMFQETRKGNLNPAIILATPFTHERTEFYKAPRKES